jgi:single-stranded-DNA-specific exonuclease
VDGITACSILWHVLRCAGASVRTYVPHRIEEGYGLNSKAVQQLGGDPSGKPLIITVDCGITAHEPVAEAARLGVDLIITDHHELPAGGLPEAYAIVHPGLPGSAYPFQSLCGAGVAFKLAWHFARLHCGSERLPGVFRSLLLDLLPLAALGTVADVVPLVDENRVITSHGLGRIKKTRLAGLNALIDAARLREEKIDAYHVGFVLGPRLNACGRMGHARQAVELLTEATAEEAGRIATFLTGLNDRRRDTERVIFDQAKQMVLDCGYDGDDCRAIVLGKEGWHAGVIGIVASRLTDMFCRPVVMLSLDNGEAVGSARSVAGVSVHDALSSCASLLTSFGGHAMAAGVRLDADKLDALRDGIVTYVNRELQPQDLVRVFDVDTFCPVSDLNLSMFEQIDRLAPFGRRNPTPLLCLRDVALAESPQRVGRDGSHLRLMVRQDGHATTTIGFGLGEHAEHLATGDRIDMVFEPKINTWKGRRRPEMRLKDLRPTEAG